MVERGLVKNFQAVLSSNPVFSLIEKNKQFFASNPGQDLNYHSGVAYQIYFNYMGN